jgi:aspartyl protease family protein
VEFLLDTGASTVAMNTGHARRLGIDYEDGRPVSGQGASEVSQAWHVVLDEVGVGQIKVRNVDAVVMKKSGYPNILLGMSFLERMDIERRGRVMVLEY